MRESYLQQVRLVGDCRFYRAAADRPSSSSRLSASLPAAALRQPVSISFVSLCSGGLSSVLKSNWVQVETCGSLSSVKRLPVKVKGHKNRSESHRVLLKLPAKLKLEAVVHQQLVTAR